jgi:hypothetical protein
MSASHKAHSRLPPRGGAVLAAALVMAALWPTDAAAQGTCTVNRATFRTEANFASTDSTTFVSIPQTALDITVGGAAPTCVIVVFSAETQTTVNENMGVRARISGFGIGEPAEVFFGPGTGAVEARAAQFVFEDVPPGDYTVRMQFRSAIAGTTVTIGRPTMVVHHR